VSAIKKPLQDAILEAAREEAESPTRLRFSLRSMMLLTVVVAVVCALLFSFPPGVAAIVCLLLRPCLIAMMLAGSIFAKGGPRFFCVGAILPTVLSMTGSIFGGGGVGTSYLSLMMLGQLYGGGNSAKVESLGDYLLKTWELFQKVGYPMFLQFLLFLLVSSLSGLAAVWTRRSLIKRTAVPAVLTEEESE